jgi:3-hydroxymyristoyl/3-hydroxydecanoyl-(acyl carrier protein) dehydratase
MFAATIGRRVTRLHGMIHLAPNHPASVGHFPGNPIMPGAVLLRDIVAAIVGDHGRMVCDAAPSIKFLHPVRPGDVLALEWTEGGDGMVRFSATLAPDGICAVMGALRCVPR